MNKTTTGMAIFLSLLMLLSMVGSVFAIETDGEPITGVPDVYKEREITLVDGEIIGDFELGNEQNLFQKVLSSLFGGDSKNFVSQTSESVQSGSYSCTLQISSLTYTHSAGQTGLFGGQCADGNHIVFKSNGGDIDSGRFLFDKAWYKDPSRQSPNWLPDFGNYYLEDLEFSYSYNCYQCDLVDVGSDEEGCLNYAKDDCVQADSSSCMTDYGLEKTCLTHIVDTNPSCLAGVGPLLPGQEYCWTAKNGVCETSNGEPSYVEDCQVTTTPPCLVGVGPLLRGQEYCWTDNNGVCETSEGEPSYVADCQLEETDITFNIIEITNNGYLVEGQQYEVTGTAYVQGVCDGCVIETGLNQYGSAFSVISSSGGACGDDKTVGIKFNAENQQVSFRLTDTATKTGRYEVSIYATSGCYNEGDSKLLDSEKYMVDIKPQPEYIPDPITCYYCVGSDVKSDTLNKESCPDSTFETRPTCEVSSPDEEDYRDTTPVITECYYCAGEELRTTFTDTSCEEGTTEVKPICESAQPVPEDCEATPGAEGCNPPPADTTCDPLVEDCCLQAVYVHDNPNDCFIDGEENVVGDDNVYLAIAVGILVLLAVVVLIIRGGKKK